MMTSGLWSVPPGGALQEWLFQADLENMLRCAAVNGNFTDSCVLAIAAPPSVAAVAH